MRIQVTIPGYRQVTLDARPDWTVNQLKKNACRKLGIEAALTGVLLDGKRLKEERRLSSLRVSKSPLVLDYLWSRQLLIWGEAGQEKLRAAKVLLAGAGAIGNEVAKNLALLGVGFMLIADRDRVEMSNVSRMIFFQPKDVGRNKAEALAENLHARYPHVITSAYRGNLEEMPLKLYLDSDVIVSGLDNAISRIFLTQTARKYSIPLVDAGIIGLTGRVQSYIPPSDTCPICLFPPNQYANIVGLRNPCEAPPDQPTVPSFATSISLVSSILAQETVKIILGVKEHCAKKNWPENSGQPLRTVLFLDLKNNRYTPMKVQRNERCIVCGKDGTARETANREEMPVADLFKRTPPGKENIRRSSKLGDGKISTYLENARGTTRCEDYRSLARRAKRGDYLRVMVEAKNGELHESIVTLT